MNVKDSDAYKNIMRWQELKTATVENTFLRCVNHFSYWYVDDEEIHEHTGETDNLAIVLFNDMDKPKYTWILYAAMDIAIAKTVDTTYDNVTTWLRDIIKIVTPLVEDTYENPLFGWETDIRNIISDIAKVKFPEMGISEVESLFG